MSWGPFTAGLEPAERFARLRSLRAMAILKCRHQRDLIAALKVAETDDGAVSEAERAFEVMPALTRRHLLASYANLFGGAR